MSDLIHPTAVIDDTAIIGKNVKIGAYCVIGPNVTIGDDNIFHSHVVVENHTTIGNGNTFFPYGSIGADPQDYTYKGEDTQLIIGSNNVFREFVTLNRGTLKEEGITSIGDGSLFMAYVHVGHDSRIGSFCTIANSCNIAGHVRIKDHAKIGGACSISQFVKIGSDAYIGGASAVNKDIPSFCTAYGNRVTLRGINIIGMKNQKIDRKDISGVVDFFRTMEASGYAPATFIDNKELMEEFSNNSSISNICEEINDSKVGVAPFASA
jgi:UDP-N-acetylglucosamine acyltransferase